MTSVIHELDREECLKLLAAGSFGRLAVTAHEHAPLIRPVNYVFDVPSQSVVIRTAPGSKLERLLVTQQAAFEVDGVDQRNGSGWSVIVSGVAEPITSASELARLQTTGPEPLAPGDKPHLVRIRAFTVSGRRIADQGAGYGSDVRSPSASA
jgi:uncharacterized protein